MTRRLYRSRTNKVIAGVCGGIGEHFDVDPTLIRLIAVVSLIGYGLPGLAYLAAWIIIPKAEPGERDSEWGAETDPFTPKAKSTWRVYLPGIILIVIGVVFLLPEYLPWFDWQDMWPLLLVLLGLVLILRSGRSSRSSTLPPVEGPGPLGKDGGIRP